MAETATNSTTKKNASSNTGSAPSTSLAKSDVKGVITLDENVVATIAGLCAAEVKGIYRVGKPRLIPFGSEAPTRGVEVEVGSKQAAVDLDIVVLYGTDIQACATRLRNRLAEEIQKMTSREVVEVNIHIADIHMPETETKADDDQEEEAPRVL